MASPSNEEKAAALVQMAGINAVGMYTPLLDRFPIMSQVDVKWWDFLVTVAGVFIAATRLNEICTDAALQDNLMQIVAKHLDEWDQRGIRAFEDCKTLFEREFDRLTASGCDPRFVAADALGIWIVWNILNKVPHMDDECMLAHTVGTMVTHAFFDVWNR